MKVQLVMDYGDDDDDDDTTKIWVLLVGNKKFCCILGMYSDIYF
jgi:hypothetical protein